MNTVSLSFSECESDGTLIDEPETNECCACSMYTYRVPSLACFMVQVECLSSKDAAGCVCVCMYMYTYCVLCFAL